MGLGRASVVAVAEVAVVAVRAVGDVWAAVPSGLGFYCYPQLVFS